MDAAIDHFDDQVATARQREVMGNQEEAGAAAAVDLAHQFENAAGGFAVEIAVGSSASTRSGLGPGRPVAAGRPTCW